MTLLGGFAGPTEPDPNIRNPHIYVSTLQRTRNDLPLVRAESVTESQLDGFYITLNPNATSTVGSPGAFNIVNSDISINNITIENQMVNRTAFKLRNRSTARLSNISFSNNTITPQPNQLFLLADFILINAEHESTLSISNIDISSTTFDPTLSIPISNPFITTLNSTINATNLTISNTSSITIPVYLINSSGEGNLEISNSTITSNTTPNSDAIWVGPDITLNIANSVFANNSTSFTLPPHATLSYTAASPLPSGTGNIDITGLNPPDLFIDPLNFNFSPLHSGPLADAGNSLILPLDHTDLDNDQDYTEQLPFDAQNNTREFNDLWVSDSTPGSSIDIGAIENQTTHCKADLEYDGILNSLDILKFNSLFNANDLAVDFTNDGILNFYDLSEFLSLYNNGCIIY